MYHLQETGIPLDYHGRRGIQNSQATTLRAYRPQDPGRQTGKGTGSVNAVCVDNSISTRGWDNREGGRAEESA